MNRDAIIGKLKKLQHIWNTQGIVGTAKFIYHKLMARRQDQIYAAWFAKQQLQPQDIAAAQQEMAQWHNPPTFSIIMPVYNVDKVWLEKAIESVRQQIYPHWQLCIADDASTEPHIHETLSRYQALDQRIHVQFQPQNQGISQTSNAALALATGDYIALLDHDDELANYALLEVARLIQRHPDADFIYSDEDKIDVDGRHFNPFFKPDWSPDYMHGCMYTCHLGVYRTAIVRAMGGFRSEYDGSQDWDLVLRLVEKTQNIYHIPKVLYHWSIIPSSAAAGDTAKPWAYMAAQKALEDMVRRSPYPGWVEPGPAVGFFRVRRHLADHPLVSIIIPSAGKTLTSNDQPVCLLENCIRSIHDLSTYNNFEIIVVDGFDLPDLTCQLLKKEKIQLVRSSAPFNFSERMNRGAAAARGDYLLMLNDDTEIKTPDWLESMLELAQQPEIGAVGAKLMFPNGRIQHSGVLVLQGNPCHAFYNATAIDPGHFFSNQINRNYIAVTGACLMVRRQVFEQVGGFDQAFPLNYNDVDLCCKIHQAGYRNLVVPYVQLIHYESVTRSSNLKPEELEQFQAKWLPYLNQFSGDPYYNPNLCTYSANFLLC
jgi:GT2 family glycosyltransferase